MRKECDLKWLIIQMSRMFFRTHIKIRVKLYKHNYVVFFCIHYSISVKK